jgi:hypothetical protein
MSVLYPVAPNAEAALNAPLGRAAREREAGVVAGAEVRFVTEDVGPLFETREAALAAYGRFVDAALAPEERYCALGERLAPVRGRTPTIAPVKPVFRDGRRWPEPMGSLPRMVWRLSVSYWKLKAEEAEAQPEPEQARKARRDPAAEALDARQLRAMARQPLQPVKPQQPLDIGLFEVRAPENQGLVLPDE